MKMWFQTLRSTMASRMAVIAIAVAIAGALVTIHFAQPAAASSGSLATPAPAAAALDDNSVSALLSLDHAMETLAARVTPAVVNVTVASKTKEQASDDNGMPDMQQFFGPDGPFGQFGNPFGGQQRRQFRQFNGPKTGWSTVWAAA